MQILDPEIVGYTKSLMLMVNHELDGSLQNHYNVYGGQQLTSHYTIGTSGSAGVYLGYFPLYLNQYPKYRASRTLTLPPAPSPSSVVTTGAGVEQVAGMLGAASTQRSSV
ncbi:hypothetical protein V6N13_108700 [Hibiscus sabdariffa]